jgi:molecular chaperone HscB
VSPAPSEGGRFDPFALLGLAPRFDLDPGAVRAAYRARAATIHPDRADLAGGDPAMRTGRARASAELGEAQRILLDPVRRGEALLELLGGRPAAGPPSGEFLVEMMEIRESIDAAGGDRAALEAIRLAIEERLGEARDRLSAILSDLADRQAEAPSGGLRIAAETLGGLRSLERLRIACEAALAGEGGEVL